MNVFNDLRQNDLNDLFDRFVCTHDVMFLFSFYLLSRIIFKNDFMYTLQTKNKNNNEN